MALFDLSLDQLQQYRPARMEPTDFDDFWQTTLWETARHALAAEFVPVDHGLRALETYDVTFSGYGGQPVKAWLVVPRHRSGPLPCVVEYIGYGGGRGLPSDWLVFASAGYAHLIMDTRGQGGGWRSGDTPDPEGSAPSVPGYMTRGVQSPLTYYYRRVISDAVRAVSTARLHPAVDASRLAVAGGSQGGGLAIAVAALVPGVQASLPDTPFLCHFRRGAELCDSLPYSEIARYCRLYPQQIDQVFATLAYVDGMNFAARTITPTLYSVALMDTVTPPSTVYAAYNHHAGPKSIRVYPYSGHEGGGGHQVRARLDFLSDLWKI